MPVPDIYAVISSCLYMTACLGTACAGLWIAVRDAAGAKACLTRPVLAGAGAVIFVQVAISVLAVVFLAMDMIAGSTLALFLANWMPVLLAAAILPAALIVEAGMRTVHGPQNRAVLAGTAMVVALSSLVLVAKGLWPDVVREHESLMALVESPAALGLLLPLALIAAPVEEVIFRGGVQGFGEKFLAGRGLPQWPAMVLASTVWAVAHVGMLEPAGVKEAQIFCIGLVLGWLKTRAGLRGTILAHLALNGLLVVVQLVGMLVGE